MLSENSFLKTFFKKSLFDIYIYIFLTHFSLTGEPDSILQTRLTQWQPTPFSFEKFSS